MNVPFVVPEDDTTPYPANFERVMAAVRAMGYALDVIEPGRAGGAIFDRVPFLVSFDTAGRFLSIRALWEPDIPAASAEHAMFATADNWNREKYFPRRACPTISCATLFRRAFRRVSPRWST